VKGFLVLFFFATNQTADLKRMDEPELLFIELPPVRDVLFAAGRGHIPVVWCLGSSFSHQGRNIYMLLFCALSV
jgi:hypothetical protein